MHSNPITTVLADEHSGVANGLASTFRLMGGAVATAIYSAILSNRFASELPGQIATVVQATGFSSANVSKLLSAAALDTASAYRSVPGITPEVVAGAQQAVKLSYVQAFKLVYLVALAFGGLAIISAFFTKSIPKEKKTMRRAVKMENEKSAEGRRDAEKVVE